MDYYYQKINAPQIIHNQKICFEPHIHNEIEIIVFFDGSAVLQADGVKYEVKKGECLLIFPDVIHSYYSEKSVDVGKFIFNANAELLDFLQNSRPKCPVIPAEKATKIPELAREILSCYENSSVYVKNAYLALLAGKLIELCELEKSETHNSDTTLQKVTEYCRKHYREDISLGTLSNALYLSKSHLSHLFCNKLKINFRQYINILRINEAKALLGQSELTVTEIAVDLGFGSLRNFDKAFSDIVGSTPHKFRKQMQETQNEM